MNEQDFNELLESVKEVGLMEKGGLTPSREFVLERKFQANSPSVKTFAICISAEDEELIPMKIYHVVLQPQHKTCTVKDESGETLVCPIEWFLPIELPKNVEQVLEKAELIVA